ncbi:MAG: alpha/beta hydrolase [Alphaproteobacteria bacterium]|nr:alpha/beta hydrolase [Alphaproteobacteria bacterium]
MPEVILNGPEGRLEARYHPGPGKGAPVALLLHPHPLYGGTMNNKVVYTLYQAFVESGFACLRFNFRGVGRSQGSYSDGIGELTDAATALDWLQQQNPNAGICWIGGFSFGSWIALQLLMRRPELEAFVAVSPPANLYDFSFLSPCPAAGLITMGDKDDVVSEEAVSKLATRLGSQAGARVQYTIIPGADHYYRNQLDDLAETVKTYVVGQQEEFAAKRRTRPDKKRRQLPRD